MGVMVHMAWLNTLPVDTQAVTVAGKTFPVAITEEDGGILATHMDTGCWGYGDTVQAALGDVALMLANEHDWYVTGEGSRMYLYGRAFQRRAAIQKAFAE